MDRAPPVKRPKTPLRGRSRHLRWQQGTGEDETDTLRDLVALTQSVGGLFLASLFLDLAFGGGPMALGFVAAAGDIPSAYPVAAVVAGLGAVGTGYAALTTRPTNPGPAAEAQ